MFARGLTAARSLLRPILRGPIGLQRQRAAFRLPRPSPAYYQYQSFQQRRQLLQRFWQDQNFRRGTGVLGVAGCAFYAYNIETVPVSGRRRFNFVGPGLEVRMAREMYEEVMEKYAGRVLPGHHPIARYVRGVMERLVPVSGLEDLNWKVFVIKDDSVKNAFVIPGGKVFVFTGMLDICRDEGGLAAVMSHEIGHTVAHHAAERLSKSVLAVLALLLVSVASGTDTSYLGNAIMDLVFLKPGSRKQEAEADYIGLMLMAQACYNPQTAVLLWKRMEKAQEFEPPQFLSTHPSHKTRIQKIQEWMPEALQKFEDSDCSGGTMDYAQESRRAFGNVRW